MSHTSQKAPLVKVARGMIGLFRCHNEIRKDNLRKEVEVKEIDYNIENNTNGSRRGLTKIIQGLAKCDVQQKLTVIYKI